METLPSFLNFALGNQNPSNQKLSKLKEKEMKKVIMTLILTTLLPITGISHYNLCHAEDIFPSTPLVPDTAPIYSSYYDDAGEMLYIYGCLSGNNAEMKVQHNETIVLYDIVSPDSLPAQYDCSGWESGFYRVTISIDSTIVTTFLFEIG